MRRFTDRPSRLALPVYASRISAGFPSPADDHIEGKLDLNRHLVRRPAATFFIRAQGESMKDAGIVPRAGDIVIAVLHGELTVKRLAMTEAGSILSADNPAYPDIRPGEAGCELWGVVTFSIRRHCGR